MTSRKAYNQSLVSCLRKNNWWKPSCDDMRQNSRQNIWNFFLRRKMLFVTFSLTFHKKVTAEDMNPFYVQNDSSNNRRAQLRWQKRSEVKGILIEVRKAPLDEIFPIRFCQNTNYKTLSTKTPDKVYHLRFFRQQTKLFGWCFEKVRKSYFSNLESFLLNCSSKVQSFLLSDRKLLILTAL